MSAHFAIPRIPSNEDIPKGIFELDQWLVTNPQKEPYSAVSGEMVDATDPRNHATFEEARSALQEHPEQFSWAAIALTDRDQIVALDIDNCFDEKGYRKPCFQTLYEDLCACGGYLELSPSGKGLRAFFYGKLPRHYITFSLGDGCKVEAWYGRGRYLTVTGNGLPDFTREIEHAQFFIDRLVERAAAAEACNGRAPRVRAAVAAPTEVGSIPRYTAAALASEIGRIQNAQPGYQNDALNRSSFAMGQLAQYIDLPATEQALLSAGLEMVNQPGRPPWTSRKLLSVIQSGMRSGAAKPRLLV